MRKKDFYNNPDIQILLKAIECSNPIKIIPKGREDNSFFYSWDDKSSPPFITIGLKQRIGCPPINWTTMLCHEYGHYLNSKDLSKVESKNRRKLARAKYGLHYYVRMIEIEAWITGYKVLNSAFGHRHPSNNKELIRTYLDLAAFALGQRDVYNIYEIEPFRACLK